MWIAQLLQLSNTMINPAPTRILYFYKRWQPLYDEIMKHVPRIEFVEGIPYNIKDDSYFDTKSPTLFILDDQMRDSAKSSDICELFTEGSHHRNLSVICLMQNLFYQGKESRTMSLNTQYLVLFKSPRDKQQISILARQMYPNRSHYFIEQYEKATQRPHGYLFVDLKQNTSEEDRLQSDIFVGDQKTANISPPSYTIPDNTMIMPPLRILANDKVMSSKITGGGYLSDHETGGINMGESTDSIHSVTGHRAGNMSDVCDDCGIVFNNTHALQKHVKRGCPEDESENELTSTKRRKFELLGNWQELHSNDKVMKGQGSNGVDDAGDDSNGDSDDDDDDIGFDRIINNVYKGLGDKYDEKVKQIMKNGTDKKDAISEAYTAMRPAFRKGLIAEYKEYLTLTHELAKSRLHRDVSKRLQQSTNFKNLLKKVIKINRPKFDLMLDSADESEDESSEEGDQTSEDDGEEE